MFDSAFFAALVALSVPILWASLGEMISERAGVLNIGLEGMVIVAAFAAFYVSWETGNAYVGILAGLVASLVLAVVMAAVAVNANANQIIVGLGLYIIGSGASALAFQEMFTSQEQVVAPHLADWAIPGLSSIPLLGHALFDQNLLVYLAYLAVPLTFLLLWRTRWGLAVRAAGEDPDTLAASGTSVRKVRWTATLASGLGGGFAGAALTVGALGVFSETISAGYGFLAIAAVLLGRWKPVGVLLACLLFGAAEALQLRLQSVGDVPAEVWLVLAGVGLVAFLWPLVFKTVKSRVRLVVSFGLFALGIALASSTPTVALPSQVWLMVPYLLAIVVLAGFVGSSPVPSALTEPYESEANRA